MLRVGLIGQGAIAQHVAQRLAQVNATLTLVLARDGREDVARAAFGNTAVATQIGANRPDIMVDCAGHHGLAQHGPAILQAGIPLITLSLGALADAALNTRLTTAAQAGQSRLILCSGAIGGLDALRAARMGRLDHVTYTGRKPPLGWAGSRAAEVLDLDAAMTAPATHFNGSARQAALLYPKNANVAAAVALAGLGFDATQVQLVADPQASGNIHQITAQGDFGEMQITLTNQTLPDNPRSATLAALSVLSALDDIGKSVRF